MDGNYLFGFKNNKEIKKAINVREFNNGNKKK